MRCPFTFANSSLRGEWSECDPKCAMRVKCSKTNIDTEEVIVGDVCAIAAIPCNLEGVTFASAFIEVVDRIDISEVLNDE